MQGELYRKRGTARDLVTAQDAFARAIAEGSAMPQAWRGLGLTKMRTGDRAGGTEALRTYLAMAPDAPDAPMMTMMAGQASPAPAPAPSGADQTNLPAGGTP